MALRNIVPPAGATSGDFSQPQYFGLAADFRPVVASGRLDFGQFDPVHIVLDGEYVWNSAFNRDAVAAIAQMAISRAHHPSPRLLAHMPEVISAG